MKSIEKGKWTKKEIETHSKKILAICQKQKKENKLANFTSITIKEIESKFRRLNSPMIIFQGWGHTGPGGTIDYFLGIYNPDPTTSQNLFAHMWVGSGNVDPVVGTFLSNIDTRFPRLAQEIPPLAPGASNSVRFSFDVPSSIQRTSYFGNSCLMNLSWHDIGIYLDRSVFAFNII